jgi:hypothetical protein
MDRPMAHSALFEHVKLKRLMRILGIPRPHAIGYLECLAHWAGGQPPYDGDLSKLDDDEIEAVAEWEGLSGAFIKACITCRFIDRDAQGTRIHDFTDWCQVYIKMRRKRYDDARACNSGARSCNIGARPAPGGAPSRAGAGAEPSRAEQVQTALAEDELSFWQAAPAEEGVRVKLRGILIKLGADEELANAVISLQPLPDRERMRRAMSEQCAANARGASKDRSAVFRRILYDNGVAVKCNVNGDDT